MSNSLFVNSTVDFLHNSDIKSYFPNSVDVHLDGNGSQNSTIKISDWLSFDKPMLDKNKVIAYTIVFSLMDACIDIAYPTLQSMSFRKKYDGLPKNTDVEIAFSQIYRLLKIVRNATVHSMNSISFSSGVNVNYTHYNTNFKLICSDKAMVLICSLVIMFAKAKNINDKYFESIVLHYYKEIFSEVASMTDDISVSGLIAVTKNPKHNIIYRNIINNPVFRIANHQVELEKVAVSQGAADYIVDIGNKKYLIPEEEFDADGRISINCISDWDYSNRDFFR